MFGVYFLDLACVLFKLELCVRHHDVIEDFTLVELVCKVVGELDVTDTVTVDAEVQFLFQPSIGVWMPLQVDI